MTPNGPRRVAVVGGSGFIGQRLVAQLLTEGVPVRVVGLATPVQLPGAEWVRCDVRDAAGLSSALGDIDLVYNLVAAHGLGPVAPEVFRELNVDCARSVCQAAAAAAIRHMIFTSTAAVYGDGASPTEDSPPHPRGHYAITKLAAEQVYREWASADPGRSLVIVRPTVVFGPGGEGTGGRLLRHVASPRFAHVGPARNRKSLAFVDNLAAFLAFVRHGPGGIRTFNYADIPDLEVAEIVAIVRSALGLAPAPRHSLARACAGAAVTSLTARLTGRTSPSLGTVRTTAQRLAREIRFDASRAHASGFHQPVPLREALERTARTDLAWIALLSRAQA